MAKQPRELPMREWLELGQAMTEKSWMPPKYFRAFQTEMIRLGKGVTIKADRKTYRAGDYVLASSKVAA